MVEKRRVRIAEKRLKMTEKKLRMTSFSVTLRALARRVSYWRRFFAIAQNDNILRGFFTPLTLRSE